MSLSRILLWSLALALVAWAAWVWPTLPEQIPLHFGIDGEPDRWGERSVWDWFALPALGLAMAATMDGLGRWAVGNPEKRTINLPQSDELYALPVERRVPVLRRVAMTLNVLGASLLAAFMLLQVGSHRAAHGLDSQGWTLAGLGISLLVPTVLLIWTLTTTSAEIARQREA